MGLQATLSLWALGAQPSACWAQPGGGRGSLHRKPSDLLVPIN